MRRNEPPRRGWGLASIPNTAKGQCEFSRITPLETYDCINEENMRAWEPRNFPGRTYKTHRRCKCQEDMTACPDYQPTR